MEAHKRLDIQVETLVNGKTVTIKSAKIFQEDKLRATARADYVLPLESRVTIDTFTPPPIKEKALSAHLRGEELPSLFQHFDNHIATEGIPFSGHDVPELGGWMRFKEAPEKISDAHLICLIDSWPPTASPYYKGFKPLSTLSWSIHFTRAKLDVSPVDHLGYLAKVSFGETGLSSSRSEIWSPGGQLLATSVQTNIIYG